jgi:hypothetical protein
LDQNFGLSLAGITEEEAKPMHSSEQDEEGQLPPRYKLLEDDQNVLINKYAHCHLWIWGLSLFLRYPKPTFFYTMQTIEGEPLLHEEALVAWLEDLVGKHPLFHLELMSTFKPSVQDLLEGYRRSLPQMEAVSFGI